MLLLGASIARHFPAFPIKNNTFVVDQKSRRFIHVKNRSFFGDVLYVYDTTYCSSTFLT